MDWKEAAVFGAKANQRIRVVVRYEEDWRPIFWLMVGKDGSVYLGPRYTNVTRLRRGTTAVRDGRVRVTYGDGRQLTNPKAMQAAKLSFHASGVINAANERSRRPSLRALTEQQLLCGVVFQHPTQYAIEPSIRRQDICLDYPVDDHRPLVGFLYVAPLGEARLVAQPSAAYQVNLLLEFARLTSTPDLTLQLVLSHGAIGPWPPDTYILWEALS